MRREKFSIGDRIRLVRNDDGLNVSKIDGQNIGTVSRVDNDFCFILFDVKRKPLYTSDFSDHAWPPRNGYSLRKTSLEKIGSIIGCAIPIRKSFEKYKKNDLVTIKSTLICEEVGFVEDFSENKFFIGLLDLSRISTVQVTPALDLKCSRCNFRVALMKDLCLSCLTTSIVNFNNS